MSKWIKTWIDLGDGPIPHDAYKCSRCGTKHWRQTNFCPNCGLDMRELEKLS